MKETGTKQCPTCSLTLNTAGSSQVNPHSRGGFFHIEVTHGIPMKGKMTLDGIKCCDLHSFSRYPFQNLKIKTSAPSCAFDEVVDLL